MEEQNKNEQTASAVGLETGVRLNFADIGKNCPKAYDLYNEWAKKYINLFVNPFYQQRILYDFFDEQNIYIVPIQSLFEGEIWWQFRIGSKEHIQIFRSDDFSSRYNAETASFIKGFEMLESKIIA